MTFCDLHSHLLFGVDDGAPDLDASLEMLQDAKASRITQIALTPHVYLEEGDLFQEKEVREENFRRLLPYAKELGITLHLSGEVHVTPRLVEETPELPIPTLGDSRYLLTEFPYYFPADAFTGVLSHLQRFGYLPVVAHPERYDAVLRDPALAERFVEMGCHLQLTASSVMGRFGSRVAKVSDTLLRRGLVCCVASDAHDSHHRSCFLMDVYDHLCLQASARLGRLLLWDNPMRILQGDEF